MITANNLHYLHNNSKCLKSLVNNFVQMSELTQENKRSTWTRARDLATVKTAMKYGRESTLNIMGDPTYLSNFVLLLLKWGFSFLFVQLLRWIGLLILILNFPFLHNTVDQATWQNDLTTDIPLGQEWFPPLHLIHLCNNCLCHIKRFFTMRQQLERFMCEAHNVAGQTGIGL